MIHVVGAHTPRALHHCSDVCLSSTDWATTMYFSLISQSCPEIAVAITTRTPSASEGELHSLRHERRLCGSFDVAVPSPPAGALLSNVVLASSAITFFSSFTTCS